jgi:hypothetical protein
MNAKNKIILQPPHPRRQREVGGVELLPFATLALYLGHASRNLTGREPPDKMAQIPEEALVEARLMRRFAELRARLIGYEIALTAIIGALDRSGALPLAAAKSAIDAAAAGLASEPLIISTEPLAVLRQLSARLEPSEPADSAEQQLGDGR